MSILVSSVRAELVEAPFFSFHPLAKEELGFDKLSPNGMMGREFKA